MDKPNQGRVYPERSFLNKVEDFTDLVDNDMLHFPSAGIDPKVLINNSTYPIKIVGREDEDNAIVLDKFETENTLVRRPDAIEYSYDKLDSVIRQHRSTLQTTTARKAAHALRQARIQTRLLWYLPQAQRQEGASA